AARETGALEAVEVAPVEVAVRPRNVTHVGPLPLDAGAIRGEGCGHPDRSPHLATVGGVGGLGPGIYVEDLAAAGHATAGRRIHDVGLHAAARLAARGRGGVVVGVRAR